jgi:hypothetical protein
MQQNQVVIGPLKTRLGGTPKDGVHNPFHFFYEFIVQRRSGLAARCGEHVVPIWQSDRLAEHAAGGRAINQEAFDPLCPVGGGCGQLKQPRAHDNELVSLVDNLGDLSFLITHKVRPIEPAGHFKAIWRANLEDIILLKDVIGCGFLDCYFGSV